MRNLFLGFYIVKLERGEGGSKTNYVCWNKDQSMFLPGARTYRSLVYVATLFDYIVSMSALSAAETRLLSAWRWFNESDVLALGRADRRLIRCTAYMNVHMWAQCVTENYATSARSFCMRTYRRAHTYTRTILSPLPRLARGECTLLSAYLWKRR